MLKRKEPGESRFVDNAKERMMIITILNIARDVALFVIVAALLTWLVLSL